MIGNKPENGERLIDGAYVKGVARGQNDGYASGIVAAAGGGQAAAVVLPSEALIEVDTVATANDSVALPVSDAGMRAVIVNNTANSMNLYANPLANQKNGNALDTINGQANANAYAIGPGVSVMLVCPKAGSWFALKSA